MAFEAHPGNSDQLQIKVGSQLLHWTCCNYIVYVQSISSFNIYIYICKWIFLILSYLIPDFLVFFYSSYFNYLKVTNVIYVSACTNTLINLMWVKNGKPEICGGLKCKLIKLPLGSLVVNIRTTSEGVWKPSSSQRGKCMHIHANKNEFSFIN